MKKYINVFAMLFAICMFFSSCTINDDSSSSSNSLPPQSSSNTEQLNDGQKVIELNDFAFEDVAWSSRNLPYYLNKTTNGVELLEITESGLKTITSINLSHGENIYKFAVIDNVVVYEVDSISLSKIMRKNLVTGEEKLLYSSRALFIELNKYDNMIYMEVLNDSTKNYEMACYDSAQDKVVFLSYTLQNGNYGYSAVWPLWVNGELYRISPGGIENLSVSLDGEIETFCTDGNLIYLSTYKGVYVVNPKTAQITSFIDNSEFENVQALAFSDSAVIYPQNGKLYVYKNGEKTVVADGLPLQIYKWYICDKSLVCITKTR